MVDPKFHLRAGSTAEVVKGTPGNVLTFQADGTLAGEVPGGGALVAAPVDVAINAINPFDAGNTGYAVDVSAFWSDLDATKDVPLLQSAEWATAGNPVAVSATITGPAELFFSVLNFGGLATAPGNLRVNVVMLRDALP